MQTPEEKIAHDKLTEASKTAVELVSNAAETGKSIIANAVRISGETVQTNEEHMTKSLSNALRDVFGENVNSGRFIDTSRIPLICQSILGIEKSIEEIKDGMNTKFITTDAFWPVKTIVYTGVGLVLTAVVGALLALVFKHH